MLKPAAPEPRRSHLTRAGLAGAFVAAALLAGCASDDDGETAAATDRPTAAAAAPGSAVEVNSEMPLGDVDVAAFAAAIGQGRVLLDVRTPAEFAEGHLEGAVNIDFQAPDFEQRVRELDPAGEYLVYCRSGNRSGQAVQVMAAAGVQRTANLLGGIVEWAAQGRPVTTGA